MFAQLVTFSYQGLQTFLSQLVSFSQTLFISHLRNVHPHRSLSHPYQNLMRICPSLKKLNLRFSIAKALLITMPMNDALNDSIAYQTKALITKSRCKLASST
jgi:hypothetical protein